jgi:hypothetical protein
LAGEGASATRATNNSRVRSTVAAQASTTSASNGASTVGAAISTLRGIGAETDVDQGYARCRVPTQATAHKQRTAGTHAAAAGVSVQSIAAVAASRETIGECQVLNRDVTAIGKENAVLTAPADGDVMSAAVDGDVAVKQRQVGVERDRLMAKGSSKHDGRARMGVGIEDP